MSRLAFEIKCHGNDVRLKVLLLSLYVDANIFALIRYQWKYEYFPDLDAAEFNPKKSLEKICNLY